jgi:hypothetical protein
MKLTDSQRRYIVMGIACLLIISGLIQGIFKIKVNKAVTDEISLVLMIIAAGVLFGGRKFGRAKEEEKPAIEEVKEEEKPAGEVEPQLLEKKDDTK